MNKVLVFISTKRLADILYERLDFSHGKRVGVIHGNKTQNFRNRSVHSFHDGEPRVLIATDVIARGVDSGRKTDETKY